MLPGARVQLLAIYIYALCMYSDFEPMRMTTYICPRMFCLRLTAGVLPATLPMLSPHAASLLCGLLTKDPAGE